MKRYQREIIEQNSSIMKESGNTESFFSSLIDFINYYFTVMYGIEINN
jgi:hypothetical protein